MDFKKSILSVLFLLSVLTAAAQQFTLSGKVSDEEGNAIELATVSCLDQGAVTMANLNGEFSLKLHSADSVVVKFSMVGYQTRTRVLRKPKGNQKLLVTLHPMKELDEVVITERGTTFGYHDLLVDYRGIPVMRQYAPVILDITHSLQQPNQSAGVTGGRPELIETVARAAIATGADGIFIETHPNPTVAKSDGANMLQLDLLDGLLSRLTTLKMAINKIENQ